MRAPPNSSPIERATEKSVALSFYNRKRKTMLLNANSLTMHPPQPLEQIPVEVIRSDTESVYLEMTCGLRDHELMIESDYREFISRLEAMEAKERQQLKLTVKRKLLRFD